VSDPYTCRSNLRVRSRTPTGATWTPGTGPGPLCVGSGPPTAGSPDSRTENTQALLEVRQGSGVDTCPGPAWCGPVRIRYNSPPRRRPDAATWPAARDVSQRMELDVRSPGCVAPAFIADKARRLTCNVPPRHLMRPVHSAVRRRPVHSTSKQCAASAFNETCPCRWQAARPYDHVHCAHHLSYVARQASSARQCCADRGYQGARRLHWGTSISCSGYSIHYVPRPTCRGSAPLYVPPLSYKREGTQRYNTHSLRLLDSQVHTSSQAQYSTQWSRVLRSSGPNHSKLLCVLVLIVHLATDKTLSPPPHLRI
jgi:hypothetical protein